MNSHGSVDTKGMRIDTEHRSGGVVIAHISGEVDLLSAPELRQWVQDTITPSSSLVLDLSDVAFLGSAGLSVLAELSEKADRDEFGWAIVASERVVLRPLEATGLVGQMRVFSDVDTAIRALGTTED